jgi:hypothetical protein
MRATAPRRSRPARRSARRDRAAGLRRPHRVAGNADDPVLLAEQIRRLHGFFGKADDPAGRELAHG